MAFSDRLKVERAEKLSLLKLQSEERFVLSIFRATAFSHNQDPQRTFRQNVDPVSLEFVEQRLGVLQDRRVEPFGEPAVDRREKITGFGALALVAPEAGKAHGGQ
jgi:hypothetical protein